MYSFRSIKGYSKIGAYTKVMVVQMAHLFILDLNLLGLCIKKRTAGRLWRMV